MSISKKTAKSTSKMRSDAGAAWGFLSPWIIGFLVFSAFPLVFSFYLSLTKWNLMGDPQFVGLQNYKEMFSGNGELGQTLLATAIFTVINVAVSILFYSHSRPASRCSSSPQHSRMCLRNCTKPRLSMEPARGSVSSTSPFQALLR